MNGATAFGRRRADVSELRPQTDGTDGFAQPRAEAVSKPPGRRWDDQLVQPPRETSLTSDQSLLELRALCLARLDPAAAGALPRDRLAVEVEKVLSEIATERRLDVN